MSADFGSLSTRYEAILSIVLTTLGVRPTDRQEEMTPGGLPMVASFVITETASSGDLVEMDWSSVLTIGQSAVRKIRGMSSLLLCAFIVVSSLWSVAAVPHQVACSSALCFVEREPVNGYILLNEGVGHFGVHQKGET